MSVNSPRSAGAALTLIATLCFVPIGYAEVPFTFSPGQPARAAEVNENFSALNEKLNQLEQQNAVERTFNYVIVDADTGVQVGVDGGSTDDGFALGPDRRVIFKLEMADGSTEAQISRMEPSPLPQVATDTRVVTLYHSQFDGTYSCTDLNAIGWYNRWAEYITERDEWWLPDSIPEQEFTNTVTGQFGVLPSGDVVIAEVSEEKIVSWAGDYRGIPCLDPALRDPSTGQLQCPPPTVQVACIVYVSARAPSLDQEFRPDNWALRVPADAAFSVVAPYASYFGIEAETLEDANAALALCNAATGDRCEIMGVGGGRIVRAYTTRALTPHEVSYSATEAVLNISPIGQVPGNRGEPRSFKGEFR